MRPACTAKHSPSSRASKRTIATMAAMILISSVASKASAQSPTRPNAERSCVKQGEITLQFVPSSTYLLPDSVHCDLSGTLVTIPGGSGAAVPVRGKTTILSTLTSSGENELTVANTLAGASVSAALSSVQSSTISIPPMPNLALACNEPEFANEMNRYHVNLVWGQTVYWYMNLSSIALAPYLYPPNALAAVRNGIYNMGNDYNDCGYTDSFPGATGQYQGDTSRYANANSRDQCTSMFPDGQNTVSFGPIDPDYSFALAYTCVTADNSPLGLIEETDTYIGSNRDIYANFPTPCSGDYDLTSIATHEWGHGFGLDHPDNGRHLTMYYTSFPCQTFARTLGQGDMLGMSGLYG